MKEKLKLSKKAIKSMVDFIKKYDLKPTKNKDGITTFHVTLEPIKEDGKKTTE